MKNMLKFERNTKKDCFSSDMYRNWILIEPKIKLTDISYLTCIWQMEKAALMKLSYFWLSQTI